MAHVHGATKSCLPCSRRFFPGAQNYAWPSNGSSAAQGLRGRNRCEMVKRHYGPEMVELLPIRCSPEFTAAKLPGWRARRVASLPDMESKHVVWAAPCSNLVSRRARNGAAANPQRVRCSLRSKTHAADGRCPGRALDASSLKTSSLVQSVIRQDNGWIVCAGYQTDQFDAVIIATPAHAAADVLESTDRTGPRSQRD